MKIKIMIMEGPEQFKYGYYEPQCKCGYVDCIYDDGYIKTVYPEWHAELQRMKGINTCDVCKNGDKYDDEDK